MKDPELKRKLDALRIERDEAAPASRVPVGRIALVVVALVLLAGAAWWALSDRAVPVRTAAAEEGGRTPGGAGAVLNASGYVTARRQATVSSKFTGKVEEVLVEEGMRVEAGQVLARLDASQPSQSLALARAQLEARRRSIAETDAQLREASARKGRLERLVRDGIASPSDWDAIEAEVAVLEARRATQSQEVEAASREVDLARQYVSDTVIRAPFAGVAISKNAQPGEMISPMSAGGSFTRTGISTIVDMSSLEIEVDVNEAYIQRVQPGQRVEAILDAYPEWTIPAHVITTIPAADRQKATVKVRIGFDALDPRILPDMGVKVSFLGAAPEPGRAAPARVVRVPRSAIRGERGQEYVLVVGADRKGERRGVTLGPGGGDPAEVVAGLRVGEKVVVQGPADLAAGTEVKEEEGS
jgi:HlyD family secretion protein